MIDVTEIPTLTEEKNQFWSLVTLFQLELESFFKVLNDFVWSRFPCAPLNSLQIFNVFPVVKEPELHYPVQVGSQHQVL